MATLTRGTSEPVYRFLRSMGLNPDLCGDFSISCQVAGVVTGTFTLLISPEQFAILEGLSHELRRAAVLRVVSLGRPLKTMDVL